MAQLPADRTKLAQAQSNMAPSFTASSQKLKDALTEAYDTVDLLNQKADNHAAAATLPHADKSVIRAKLADKVIGAGQLDDAAVGQSHHQDNGIPSRALPDNVILQRHMSDNSVGPAEIQTGAVQSQHLAPGSVTADKLPGTLITDAGITAELDKRGVSVQRFGAKGDGVTDDTEAIRATINAAIGKMLYFPPATGYVVSDTITVGANISVVMDAPIYWSPTAPQDRPCLIVGNAAVRTLRQKYRLQVFNNRSVTVDTWANENFIGIKLINIASSTIEITRAERFCIPLQVSADGPNGCSYNNFYLNDIINGKYVLDITCTASAWVTENLFIGGKFNVTSSAPTNISRYGVRIGGAGIINNNIFQKPSFELSSESLTGGAEALPVLINNGVRNHFLLCRTEQAISAGKGAMRCTTIDCYDNYFTSARDTYITETSVLDPASVSNLNFTGSVLPPMKKLWESGQLTRKYAQYMNGVDLETSFGGVHVQRTGDTTLRMSDSVFTINGDTVVLDGNHGIGIFVDTSLCKRFMLTFNAADTASKLRFNVCCFDSAGNRILDSAGAVTSPNDFYVARGNYSMSWRSTYFGGSYDFYPNITTPNTPILFAVRNEVKKIQILIKGFGGVEPNLAKIKSFALYTPDLWDAAVWHGFEHVVENHPSSPNKKPDAGTYAKYAYVRNQTPDELGTAPNKYIIKGWRASVAGSPGTWLEERVLTGN